MRKVLSQTLTAALVAGLSVTLVGCGKIRELQGRMAIRAAHGLYQGQDWVKAAAKYEEVIASDPSVSGYSSYFFLGNSYDNMFIPGKTGDPANEALLAKAIDNYTKAAELQTDPKMKNLALQYLVAAYGPDKLNDPGKAEPLIQRMIQMDPNEPANYFHLSRIYQDSGEVEKAEAALVTARQNKPKDPAVYMQLAGFYATQGDFPKTIEAVEARAAQDPTNPEAFYTVATYYWDKAYRDLRAPVPEKMKYIQSGLDAINKALAINSDYIEAFVYKNLLLRLMANLEKNLPKQQALLKEADQLRNRAEELRKLKASGITKPGA